MTVHAVDNSTVIDTETINGHFTGSVNSCSNNKLCWREYKPLPETQEPDTSVTRPLPRYVSPAEYRRGRNTTLKFFPFA